MIFIMGKEGFKVTRLLSLMLFFSVILLPSAQGAPITLSLEQAVQRMLDNNLSVKTTLLGLESAEISYDQAWFTFYVPTISLTSSASSSYSYGDVPFSPARTANPYLNERGYPSSSVTLTLGSYTLFNSFKDRLTFDRAKLNYEVQKKVTREALRTARNSLMILYFKTKISQGKLEVTEKSMTISEAIVELMESKKRIGKATEDEVNSAGVDLLAAKKEYLTQKKDVEQNLIALNAQLNAPPDTEFTLTTDPPYVPVQLDEKKLFEIFKTQSPAARSAENSLLASEIDLAMAEKSRLPLPEVKFSGLAMKYESKYAGGTPAIYEAGSNGFMEMTLGVSVTVPILGPNGFLGQKTVRLAEIGLENTLIAQKTAIQSGENLIKSALVNINQLQSQIKNLKEAFSKAAKVLDSTFKKSMSSAGADRTQLRNDLTQARQSELDYLQALSDHISAKNDLAIAIGMDRLPGEQ